MHSPTCEPHNESDGDPAAQSGLSEPEGAPHCCAHARLPHYANASLDLFFLFGGGYCALVVFTIGGLHENELSSRVDVLTSRIYCVFFTTPHRYYWIFLKSAPFFQTRVKADEWTCISLMLRLEYT